MNSHFFKIIFISLCIVAISIYGYMFQKQHPTEDPENQPGEIHTFFNGGTTTKPLQNDPGNVNIEKPDEFVSEPDYTSRGLIKDMTLTFADEFNSFNRYTDANGNITCEPGGTGTWQTVFYFCSRTISANNEAEVYIDQNFLDYMNSQSATSSTAVSPFSVHNGVLEIQANPSDTVITTAVGPWAQYTSGLITTQFSFSQTYGYFEARIKVPAGKGLWPAFWLLPTDKSWPPEIDVLESFGEQSSKGEGGRTVIHYASHTVQKDKSCGAWHDVGVDITKDFHVYGVNWQPTGITYYFDGQPYVTCQANPHANSPFYILLNLAVGGNGSWPETPDGTNTWPASMFIDYVRVYQKR